MTYLINPILYCPILLYCFYFRREMMIKHIVMFKLKDEAEGNRKEENARKIKEILDALPKKISQIKLYEVGINISESPSAADLCLVSGFQSVDDLNKYRVHPDHQKALDFILKVIDESRVVDYEI
jgi:hypothetical protein